MYIKLHAPKVSAYDSCRCLCVSLFTASCNTPRLDPGLLAWQLLRFTYLWLFCQLPQLVYKQGHPSRHSDQSTDWTSEEFGVRQPLGVTILHNMKAVLEFGSIPFPIPVVWPTFLIKVSLCFSHSLNAGTWPCNKANTRDCSWLFKTTTLVVSPQKEVECGLFIAYNGRILINL